LLRSFDRLMAVDLGIDPDSFVTMEVEPVDPAPAVRKQFYSALLEAIGALPDVAAVGAIDSLPLGGGVMRVTRATAGELDSGPANLRVLQVMPGYFEAVGLEASMGRLPTEADLTSAEHVAVINEQAERQFFSERSPVGLLLRTPGNDPPRRIIGVVQNVWHSGPQFPLWSEAFSVYGHVEPEPLTIVVRPYPGRGVSNDQLRRLARAVGPAVLLGQIRHGSDWLDDRVATPRQRTAILSLLGGFGLILTLVGIFSMTAYAVARRTRDIGVSVALGAQPIDVVGRMVGEAMWPVVVGLMLGLGGAYYASRVVERFLFETRPHDPVTFAAVALVMGATALVAAWIPARRAATVDPILALRAE
jgi:hypothetical protein